jgi:hypothetical protein
MSSCHPWCAPAAEEEDYDVMDSIDGHPAGLASPHKGGGGGGVLVGS